jgi:uncharacterized protein with von Willebrand factor type A (vWA) domain
MPEPQPVRNTPLWRESIESVLEADRFDLEDWRVAVQSLPQLSQADRHAGEEFCGHPVQDGFLSLYKSAPQLIDAVAPQLAPLADLLQRGMQTPEWARLRESTLGDHVAAGVGASAFVEETLSTLPADVKEKARHQAQEQAHADRLQQQASALTDLLDALHEHYGDAVPLEAAQQIEEIQQQADDLHATLQAAAAQADQLRSECQAALDQSAPQIAAALNKAAASAREQADEATTFVRGFSLAAGNDGQAVSPETARLAMETLRSNPNLKDLADLLGWARQLVRGEWRKSPRARTELVGYKTHALQPEHMAGYEWAAVLSGDETLDADWLRRAVDGGISHRQYGGREQKGRGPLIVVRDESGSMSGAPHALAVALEWALLEIAIRDKRLFYSIPFSGRDQYDVWVNNLWVKPAPQALADHLSHFYNGGTEPYGPLIKACEIVNQISDDDQRADVLIITDGLFGEPSPQLLESVKRAREHGPFKVALVSVGTDNPHAHTFADPVIHVDDLLKEREQLRGAIATIV